MYIRVLRIYNTRTMFSDWISLNYNSLLYRYHQSLCNIVVSGALLMSKRSTSFTGRLIRRNRLFVPRSRWQALSIVAFRQRSLYSQSVLPAFRRSSVWQQSGKARPNRGGTPCPFLRTMTMTMTTMTMTMGMLRMDGYISICCHLP